MKRQPSLRRRILLASFLPVLIAALLLFCVLLFTLYATLPTERATLFAFAALGGVLVLLLIALLVAWRLSRRSVDALSPDVKEGSPPPYAELTALFERLEQKGKTIPEYWVWDGIHPTPAGHHRMARLWLKRVM